MTAANVKGWTPGPWFVGEAFHHTGERQNVTPVYARHPDTLDGRWLIAWCHQNAVPRKHVKPNAHLIAAAPDLYEALEELLRVDDEWHGAINSEMAGARAKARAALSRATGAATKGDNHD